MKQSFKEITEQIKSGEIKFHYSDKVFQDFEPQNIDQLIYIAVDNYTYYTLEEFDGYVDDLEFRTNNDGDTSLKRLLENNIKSTGFYFDISGPQDSTVCVEVEFPEYDNETDFEEYIDDLFSIVDDRIVDRCYDFDADDEFDQLWNKSSYYTARQFLEILDEDAEFFEELSDKVKANRIYNSAYDR